MQVIVPLGFIAQTGVISGVKTAKKRPVLSALHNGSRLHNGMKAAQREKL